MPKIDSLVCPSEDDIDNLEIYLDILVLEHLGTEKLELSPIIRSARILPIKCKTCGRRLKSRDDALRCFEAEHQLPAADELPLPFPDDRVTATLYHTIFLCGMVETGEVRYLGRKKSRPVKN